MYGDTSPEEDEHGPWPAFADLLAATTLLFLVLFIVLLVPQLQNRQTVQAKLDTIERELKALESEGDSVRIRVTRTQTYVRVTLEEETTFPRDRWGLDDLRDDGREALRRLAQTIKDRGIIEDINQIQVVGHASPDGSNKRNWEVSAGRAAMVALFLTDHLDPCKITALGRSANFPPESVPEDYDDYSPRDSETSRRIELEIHPEGLGSDNIHCIPYEPKIQ